MTNNAAPRRDYRHQKMNALLDPSDGMYPVVTLVLSFPLDDGFSWA